MARTMTLCVYVCVYVCLTVSVSLICGTTVSVGAHPHPHSGSHGFRIGIADSDEYAGALNRGLFVRERTGDVPAMPPPHMQPQEQWFHSQVRTYVVLD